MSKINAAADAYMSDFGSDWIIEGGGMRLNLGDVVVLKSGGPRMTVAGPTRYGHIHTKWFEEGSGPYEADFEPEMLELADNDDAFYESDLDDTADDDDSYDESDLIDDTPDDEPEPHGDERLTLYKNDSW